MFYNFGASVASWPTLNCGAHSRKKIYILFRPLRKRIKNQNQVCH